MSTLVRVQSKVSAHEAARMTGLDVDYWETPAGRCPVKDFLDELDRKARLEVLTTFDAMGHTGLADVRICKKLTNANGLWEIRVRVSRLALRFLGAVESGKIILFHAFKKKDQKIPQEEIQVALRRFVEYRRGK